MSPKSIYKELFSSSFSNLNFKFLSCVIFKNLLLPFEQKRQKYKKKEVNSGVSFLMIIIERFWRRIEK